MTNVASAEDTWLEQITKQLNKLINVIKIVEQDDEHWCHGNWRSSASKPTPQPQPSDRSGNDGRQRD